MTVWPYLIAEISRERNKFSREWEQNEAYNVFWLGFMSVRRELSVALSLATLLGVLTSTVTTNSTWLPCVHSNGRYSEEEEEEGYSIGEFDDDSESNLESDSDDEVINATSIVTKPHQRQHPIKPWLRLKHWSIGDLLLDIAINILSA
eukprot:m.64532 g.64532  ORF g.64532 m.64532 type:complete len:148 (+) comp11490_c0_seq1:1748-2191(+)